jgi:hypothetical protein
MDEGAHAPRASAAHAPSRARALFLLLIAAGALTAVALALVPRVESAPAATVRAPAPAPTTSVLAGPGAAAPRDTALTGPGAVVRLPRDTVFPSAALIVIYSERRRSLLGSLANWAANAWWMTRYELVIFYVEGLAAAADLAAFAALAPGWRITLLPFSYDAAWQTEAYAGGGGGGPYISWLLAHEIYFNTSALDRFDYFMRMDDDITFTRPSVGDPFLELALSGARVGWKQLIPDNDAALKSDLFDRARAFGATFAALSDVWPVVTDPANRGPNTISNWRPYLVAGCVEIYRADVFRTEGYRAYLTAVGAADLLKRRAAWEQEVKTMWMQLSVRADEWRCVACLLPLTHKGERHHDNTWFVDKDCDYDRGVLLRVPNGNRGSCGADAAMRFC